QNKNSKSKLKSKLLENPYRGALTQQLKRKIERKFPKSEIDFAVVINKFILLSKSQKADTIFSEKPIIGNSIYGSLTSLEDSFSVRNYVGTTSGFKNSDYKLLAEETLFVSVKNWEQIILRRMI